MMLVEITTTVNLHKEDKGKSKLVKRNVKIKQYIDTDHIKSPSQIVDQKGNIRKGKFSVYIKDIGETVIDLDYTEVKKLISEDRVIIKGFKR